MKKLLVVLGFIAIPVGAQVRVSDLPSATTLTGTEQVPIVQAGQTRRATTGQLVSLAGQSLQARDGDLDALAGVTGINTLYYRSANNVWSPVTFSGLTFSGGTLTATGGGNGGGGDMYKSDNLAGLANYATARSNLGLGTAAVLNTGTAAGTIPLIGIGGTLTATTFRSQLNGNAYAELNPGTATQTGYVSFSAADGTLHSYIGYATATQPLYISNSRGTGVAFSGGTVAVPASTAGAASLNVPQGTTPTNPVNGDIWTTSAGMYVRINGATVGPLSTGGGSALPPAQTISSTAILDSDSGGTSTRYIHAFYANTTGSTRTYSITVRCTDLTANSGAFVMYRSTAASPDAFSTYVPGTSNNTLTPMTLTGITLESGAYFDMFARSTSCSAVITPTA